MIYLSEEERTAWRTLYANQISDTDRPAIDQAIDGLVQMRLNFKRAQEKAANTRKVYALLAFIGGGFIGGLGSTEWGHPMGGIAAIVFGAIILGVFSAVASFREDRLSRRTERALLKLGS